MNLFSIGFMNLVRMIPTCDGIFKKRGGAVCPDRPCQSPKSGPLQRLVQLRANFSNSFPNHLNRSFGDSQSLIEA